MYAIHIASYFFDLAYETNQFVISCEPGCLVVFEKPPGITVRRGVWDHYRRHIAPTYFIPVYRQQRLMGEEFSWVSIPLLFLFAPLFIVTLLAWKKARKNCNGHCVKCRYDLTGNISGVCPECGTPIERMK
jgi:hypothetical protein